MSKSVNDCAEPCGGLNPLPAELAPLLPQANAYSCVKRVESCCRSERRRPERDGPVSLGVPTTAFGHLKCLRTRWFVLRLSICLRNTNVQRSLHRNLITSKVSRKRGRSRENLDRTGHDHPSASDGTWGSKGEEVGETRCVVTFPGQSASEASVHREGFFDRALSLSFSPLDQSLSHSIAQGLQSPKGGFSLLVLVQDFSSITGAAREIVREPVRQRDDLD